MDTIDDEYDESEITKHEQLGFDKLNTLKVNVIDRKLEILKKLKLIYDVLQKAELEDLNWKKYYHLMIDNLHLLTSNTTETPWGLRNKYLYMNYEDLMTDYKQISENPINYYKKNLYEKGELEKFIDIYATDTEIDLKYPKLKEYILNTDGMVSSYVKGELIKIWNVQTKADQEGGKRKSKGKSKKVAKKPVVSQKKQSIYKEILGKQMKIYKMPDSRKEYVKYKGELLHISDYKDLMKQKALAKSKPKAKSKK